MDKETVKRLQTQAEEIGCIIVHPKPYEEYVIVNGQKVALPYTNGDMLAILENTSDGWVFRDRAWNDANAAAKIKDILESIKEND